MNNFNSNRQNILLPMFLLLFLGTSTFAAWAKPTMIWLRPKSYGVVVVGTRIVAGPELQFMRWLADRLPEYEHQFESYPLKRNWHLIKHNRDPQQAYCFYGATHNVDRETWGVFTEPTTVLLPYPIVAKQGSLDAWLENDMISVATLMQAGKSTALFNGVTNMWTSVVEQYSDSQQQVFTLDAGERDVGMLSAELLKKGRIDFAFVGSGQQEISKIESKLAMKLSVYQTRELADNVVAGNRLLCEKSVLGQNIAENLNKVLFGIQQSADVNREFRDLNFEVIGYHPSLRPAFNYHWQQYFATN